MGRVGENERMERGSRATLEFTVGEADTAAAVGSGDLPVLGTPILLAWCEAATCAAVAAALGVGETSVGTRVSLEHLAASPVGERLSVSATLVYVDGRLLRFEVVAVRSRTSARSATPRSPGSSWTGSGSCPGPDVLG